MVFARLAVVLALKLNRSVTLWAQRERQRELDTLLRVKSALEKRPPIPVPGREQEIVGLPGLHRELRERRLYDVSQRFYRQHDIWGERAQGVEAVPVVRVAICKRSNQKSDSSRLRPRETDTEPIV